MKLQVALDLLNLEDAIKIADMAAGAGAQVLEVGTPLIKSEGLRAIREIKKRFSDKIIFADMKIMDTGCLETEMAAGAGADIVQVLGAAPDDTIKEAVKAGKKAGVKICCDLIGIKNPVERAIELEKLGVDYINLHIGIDQQAKQNYPYQTLDAICKNTHTPIIVAGGITDKSIEALRKFSNVEIAIVGKHITSANNPKEATKLILSKMI